MNEPTPHIADSCHVSLADDGDVAVTIEHDLFREEFETLVELDGSQLRIIQQDVVLVSVQELSAWALETIRGARKVWVLCVSEPGTPAEKFVIDTDSRVVERSVTT